MNNHLLPALELLAQKIDGKIKTDAIYRELYATDASIYFERPVGVAFPKSNVDIQKILLWANEHNCSVIPRGAGTSLAGQVVGNGLIVDTTRFMNKVLEVDPSGQMVTVQPGIVLDELNRILKPHDLLFGPETSTANRCVLGGMLGNNSCGLHSLVYGAVRDQVEEIKGFAANGEEITFKLLTDQEYAEKRKLKTFEGEIYRHIFNLVNEQNQEKIKHAYPHPDLKRRNNGYALDSLSGTVINLSTLIAGSEGTLFFATEIKLRLSPLPPQQKVLLCIHCNSVHEALEANIEALKFSPSASELMDHPILELATQNKLQRENLFFIDGNPGGVLMVEFWNDKKEELVKTTNTLIENLKNKGLGYSYPVVYNEDIKKVWNVRKAGLGVLMNMVGDAKPTCIIEDTAVIPQHLPDYIDDMDAMLKSYGKEAVYYGHAGSGELHIRPVINLKSAEDRVFMRKIAEDTLQLVKKYRGSISGEHGDGRLRGEFLKEFYGQEIYTWFQELKNMWDPQGILNPNKIVNAQAMDSNLRVDMEKKPEQATQHFDWSESAGFTRAIERCTGAGDCRKSAKIGGTMCPSFMALKDEKYSTRARANALRSFIYGDSDSLNEAETKEVLDLCLSCKACKSECPSNVDMAKLKAEFLAKYQEKHGISQRTKLIGNFAELFKIAAKAPLLYHLSTTGILGQVTKRLVGFHPQRSFPKIHKFELPDPVTTSKKKKTILLYIDEFTQYNDGWLGVKAVRLFEQLGYEIIIPDLKPSGRTFLSKGLLSKARKLAIHNINQLNSERYKNLPFVGLEPSALLTFRDEYPDLVSEELKAEAQNLANRSFTFEEYIHKEWKNGNIEATAFHEEPRQILFHAHCYQKALSRPILTREILSIPTNYSATEIPSGCCGMAGAFGYEKEHYDLSMQVGELQLFPVIRNAEKGIIIVASGTSCRHQILDGTKIQALHPVEILFDALR